MSPVRSSGDFRVKCRFEAPWPELCQVIDLNQAYYRWPEIAEYREEKDHECQKGDQQPSDTFRDVLPRRPVPQCHEGASTGDEKKQKHVQRADESDIAVEDVPGDGSLFDKGKTVYKRDHPSHVERYKVDRYDHPQPVQLKHPSGNRCLGGINANMYAPLAAISDSRHSTINIS